MWIIIETFYPLTAGLYQIMESTGCVISVSLRLFVIGGFALDPHYSDWKLFPWRSMIVPTDCCVS